MGATRIFWIIVSLTSRKRSVERCLSGKETPKMDARVNLVKSAPPTGCRKLSYTVWEHAPRRSHHRQSLGGDPSGRTGRSGQRPGLRRQQSGIGAGAAARSRGRSRAGTRDLPPADRRAQPSTGAPGSCRELCCCGSGASKNRWRRSTAPSPPTPRPRPTCGSAASPSTSPVATPSARSSSWHTRSSSRTTSRTPPGIFSVGPPSTASPPPASHCFHSKEAPASPLHAVYELLAGRGSTEQVPREREWWTGRDRIGPSLLRPLLPRAVPARER